MDRDSALGRLESYVEKGLGREEFVSRYNQTAAQYGQLTDVLFYNGPAKLAATMAALYPCDRDKMKILDVAAGTGLVGEQLSRVGFTQIDAVDPSPGMLDVARERNVYGRIICDFMDDKHQLDIQDNHYDAVTTCGGMGDNHLTPGAFSQMIRVVKPGGVIVYVTGQELFIPDDEYATALESYFRQLEDCGKWQEESHSVFPDYYDHRDGVVSVHRVLV